MILNVGIYISHDICLSHYNDFLLRSMFHKFYIIVYNKDNIMNVSAM